MKLSVTGLGFAVGVLWSGAVLFCTAANALWPPYGAELLQLVASIYPGYHPGSGLMSIAVGTGYAMLDGAVGGMLLAWLYNRCVRVCSPHFSEPSVLSEVHGR